jgi:hypothetical protein
MIIFEKKLRKSQIDLRIYQNKYYFCGVKYKDIFLLINEQKKSLWLKTKSQMKWLITSRPVC